MILEQSRTVYGNELFKKRIVTFDFCLKERKYILIKGYVFNPENLPIENAAVEITIVDNSNLNNTIIDKMITYSESGGMYGISVPFSRYYSYIVKAFSP